MASSEGALLDNLIAEADRDAGRREDGGGQVELALQYKNMELEPLHQSLGKRLYSQINVLLMLANTLNAIFTISAAVSLIPQYDFWSYDFCVYGRPMSVEIQCPYLSSPTFICLLVVWTLYFLTIFSYYFHRTFDFWTNDLRFYLACEVMGYEWFLRVMVLVGVVLTLISSVTGIYFVFQNGSTASLGNILVYTMVNNMNLYAMQAGTFPQLSGVNVLKKYPYPVMFRMPKRKVVNLNGMFVGRKELFDYIQQAVLASYFYNEDSMLARIGDATQLKHIVATMLPPELQAKVATTGAPNK